MAVEGVPLAFYKAEHHYVYEFVGSEFYIFGVIVYVHVGIYFGNYGISDSGDSHKFCPGGRSFFDRFKMLYGLLEGLRYIFHKLKFDIHFI